MRVRRTDILPLAEDAIRKALREAVRQALRDVGLAADAEPVPTTPKPPAPRPDFPHLSDEEAWERFDSIRFARLAGMSHKRAS